MQAAHRGWPANVGQARRSAANAFLLRRATTIDDPWLRRRNTRGLLSGSLSCPGSSRRRTRAARSFSSRSDYGPRRSCRASGLVGALGVLVPLPLPKNSPARCACTWRTGAGRRRRGRGLGDGAAHDHRAARLVAIARRWIIAFSLPSIPAAPSPKTQKSRRRRSVLGAGQPRAKVQREDERLYLLWNHRA